MTEAEWLACDNPRWMMAFLGTRCSVRQARLFACACCRRLDRFLTGEESRKALDAAERYADGAITDGTARRWLRRAQAERERNRRHQQDRRAEVMAPNAIGFALLHGRYEHLRQAHQFVAQVFAFQASSTYGTAQYRRADASAERDMVPLLRDIAGNPFRPLPLAQPALPPTVVRLAQAAYGERFLPSGHLDPARLAVLSDALEEAGCADADLLSHLRSPGPHVRGCWGVDLVLGKS